MFHSNRFPAVALLYVFALLSISPWARCDVFAVGAADIQTDTDSFVQRSGSGAVCITVIADGVVNPGPGVPCTTTPGGFIGTLFGLTQPGKEFSAIKTAPSTSLRYFNAASARGTTSFGQGDWTYTFGTLLDEGEYFAQTQITPTPPTVVAKARVSSHDPVIFDAPLPGVLGVQATLPSFSLGGVTGIGVDAGFGTGYNFDGEDIFSFSILATSGFAGVDDLDIFYSSIRGASFDAAKRAEILAALSIDPLLGNVSLTQPIELFPRTEIAFGIGTHEHSHGVVTRVQANIPEPSSLLILGCGSLIVCFYSIKRRKQTA